MAKIPCEIIRDLLPLYQDDICSEKSRNAIEEHIISISPLSPYCFNTLLIPPPTPADNPTATVPTPGIALTPATIPPSIALPKKEPTLNFFCFPLAIFIPCDIKFIPAPTPAPIAAVAVLFPDFSMLFAHHLVEDIVLVRSPFAIFFFPCTVSKGIISIRCLYLSVLLDF